jgi:hypothetical protein
MTDLKEAVVKSATQAWCEPLGGQTEGARYPQLPKPNILFVILSGMGGGWAGKAIDLTR